MDATLFDELMRNPSHPFHAYHMEMALEEARAAYDEEEVPIGAVVVHLEQGVIARRTTSESSSSIQRRTPR